MVSKSVMYGLTACLAVMLIGTLVLAASDLNQKAQVNGNVTNHSVLITNFAFEPQELNVTVNSSVTWTNEDSAPHTIVTDTGAMVEIRSPNMNKGDTFEFNFTKAGIYPYHCSVHPSMTGAIQVHL